MITEVSDYFAKGCGRCERFDTPGCSALQWAAGLAELRRICRAAGLEEAAKWGHPCYMRGGRNIAILGAFRDEFRLTFFDAALLSDPEGRLVRKGAFTAHPDILRFTDAAEVSRSEDVIRGFLAQAIENADRGIRPPRRTDTPDMPDELVEALDADPALAEAFAALTPGRRKSYVIALASAKRPETRVARIVRFRDRILAGKGALDR